jgi:exoribonuclease-2
MSEIGMLTLPASSQDNEIVDLRQLLWCSIDNDDSMDLDQLTAAEALDDGRTRIWVAIADVDSLVNRGSAVDAHALHNTTSIYTAAVIFPMLPEKLSTNLTSLNPDEDRISMVVEMVIRPDGKLEDGIVYRALVHNYAKLAYDSVSAWLEGRSSAPEALERVPGLMEAIRLQDKATHSMEKMRHSHGALSLETIEAKPIFDQNMVISLQRQEKNRARALIENLMIAANTVTANFLTDNGYPSIRRVVHEPKRWDRIVEIVRELGGVLPARPDALALQEFLSMEKERHPLTFPDISLSIIKLIGSGEYVAEKPGREAPGHFGLAVSDYAHSTAPNRRYPDLIIQRLLKAALLKEPTPYSYDTLEQLARHLTIKEDDAQKVERTVAKSAAALMLSERVGESFEGVITGAGYKGTWVRVLSVPVEGKLVRGGLGLDVGQRVRVKLLAVDIDHGYIDFQKM